MDATMAFVGGARTRGARVVKGAHVSGVTADGPRVGGGGGGAGATIPLVTGVTLASGETIKANAVANCTGMWARQLGERCGARDVPNQAAEHYYLISSRWLCRWIDRPMAAEATAAAEAAVAAQQRQQ